MNNLTFQSLLRKALAPSFDPSRLELGFEARLSARMSTSRLRWLQRPMFAVALALAFFASVWIFVAVSQLNHESIFYSQITDYYNFISYHDDRELEEWFSLNEF